MSTAGLYLRETPGEHPITVHAAPPCAARVINTLLRIVHGGSVGWGGLPHGYPDNLYPDENQDPDKNRIVIKGVPGRIIEDRPRKQKSRRDRRSRGTVLMNGCGKMNQPLFEFTMSLEGTCLFPKRQVFYRVA